MKINNKKSMRYIDDNGFLYVERSPILISGVLEYLGSELIADDNDVIAGVKIEKDKVYKVFISAKELEKGKETFKLIPIVDDHKWLGEDGANARDYQEGTTGERVEVKDGYLYIDLKFTNLETIEKIENNEKTELSASYTNELERSKNKDYDFVASNLKANHLALVDMGRCGRDVRVMNGLAFEISNSFEESEHPRDKDGKFASGEGSNKDDKKVIQITGKELGEYKDIKELREKAIEYYKDNLAGKKVKNETLGEINFSEKGFKKPISFSADEKKLLLFPYLQEIIINSKVIKEEKEKYNRDNIEKWFLLENKIKIKDKEQNVRINIRQDNNGKLYYDHFIVKEKGFSPTYSSNAGGHKTLTSKNGIINNITQNEIEVNIFFVDDNENNKKKENKMSKEKSILNDAKLIIDGKEIDLNKFFKEELGEGEHDDAIKAENEEEKKKVTEFCNELMKKLEGEKKEKSEDEKIETDNEDDKEDKKEEGKKEKKEEEKGEKKEEEKEKLKAQNYEAIHQKIYNSVKEKLEKDYKEIVRVYNTVKEITGEFNFYGMSARDILIKGLKGTNIKVENESNAELEAMIKVAKQTTKIDNNFVYGNEYEKDSKEEIEINI
ncbi:MAG: DUF2213 domain-containing protein [Elusimicrobiota bacterium]|jgi:hypothetical protein|nr:DUF2213 domain-containing protein [Elusimicrobiota bacterium]